LPHRLDDQADRVGRADDALRGRILSAQRSDLEVPSRIRKYESRAARSGGGTRKRALQTRAGKKPDHVDACIDSHRRVSDLLSWNYVRGIRDRRTAEEADR